MVLHQPEKDQQDSERQLLEDGKKRIQCLVGLETKYKLERLARYYGYTISELIENLAGNAENTLLNQIPVWEHDNAYYHYSKDIRQILKRSLGRPPPRDPTR